MEDESRPAVLDSKTHYAATTCCGKVLFTVGLHEGKPYELLIRFEDFKADKCQKGLAEGFTRMVSLLLKSGVEPKKIIKQLAGIHCGTHVLFNGRVINSCLDAVSKILELEFDKAATGTNSSAASEVSSHP